MSMFTTRQRNEVAENTLHNPRYDADAPTYDTAGLPTPGEPGAADAGTDGGSKNRRPTVWDPLDAAPDHGQAIPNPVYVVALGG